MTGSAFLQIGLKLADVSMVQAQWRRKARVTAEADSALAGAHPREMLPVQLPVQLPMVATAPARSAAAPRTQVAKDKRHVLFSLFHYIAFHSIISIIVMI